LHSNTTVSNTKQTAVEQSGGAEPTMGGATVGMRLGIFGTGYAGLVTSVGLAEVGHTVTAIDKDPGIVARLSDGMPTIHEPGLQELLTANLEAGRLRFTTRGEDIRLISARRATRQEIKEYES
jgi:UDP-N-acetyl-D-mannosaminuronate dehydrogenase